MECNERDSLMRKTSCYTTRSLAARIHRQADALGNRIDMTWECVFARAQGLKRITGGRGNRGCEFDIYKLEK